MTGEGMKNLSQTIEAELQPGERVFWMGRPDANVWRRRWGKILIPMVGLWLLLAAFWIWIEVGGFLSDSSVDRIGAIWMRVFIAAGFLFWAFLGWLGWDRTRHTLYAITGRRVVIMEGRHQVTSYAKADLGSLKCEDSAATGDVLFGESGWQDDGRRKVWADAPGLIGVANPREVERLIRRHVLTGEPG